MKLTFLGTGSGRTSLTRGHTSLLFTNKNSSVLIDCGEGTSKTLLTSDIPLNEIDTIIISHFHADHIAGLPGLLTQYKLSGRAGALNILVPVPLKELLVTMLNSFFLFAESFRFPLNISEYEYGVETEITEGLLMTAAKNSHIVNKHNVTSMPQPSFVSSSFRFTAGGKSILYTADIGSGDDLFLFDGPFDYIISETTHIQPEKLLQALVRYEPETIFLTHIDDEYKLNGWHSHLDKKIKRYFRIAEEGMKLEI